MTQGRPLVSVIVPAYNAAMFVGAAINSARRQTYQHLEIIVVDDGSSDRTAEVAYSIAKCDHRVRVIRQANSGVAAARNTAIRASRGQFIAPLDADDIWYPSKIERQVERMLSAPPSVGLVYSWSVYLDERGRFTGDYYAHDLPRNVYATLIFQNIIGCASIPLIRRECLDRVGMYNEAFAKQNAQGSEDLDLYLRIAERYDFLVVKEFLVGYRQTNGCMSSNTDAMAKSFCLTIRDCRRRRPAVSRTVIRWSLAWQFFYLHGRARCDGRPWAGLKLLLRAIRTDPAILGRREFYQRLLAGPLERLQNAIRQSRRHYADNAAAARPSIAKLRTRCSNRPTPLFEIFEDAYQRRLRSVESMPMRGRTNSAVNRIPVGLSAHEALVRPSELRS